jgi:hypothetical protein
LLSAVPNPEAGLRQEPLARRDLDGIGAGTELVEARPGHFVRRQAA